MRETIAGNTTRATASTEIRRHALLLFDYFTQYAKVRIGYRGDFFISLAASFAATVFGLFFVVVLFQKVPKFVKPGRGRHPSTHYRDFGTDTDGLFTSRPDIRKRYIIQDLMEVSGRWYS